jgi:hypothetical protein
MKNLKFDRTKCETSLTKNDKKNNNTINQEMAGG